MGNSGQQKCDACRVLIITLSSVVVLIWRFTFSEQLQRAVATFPVLQVRQAKVAPVEQLQLRTVAPVQGHQLLVDGLLEEELIAENDLLVEDEENAHGGAKHHLVGRAHLEEKSSIFCFPSQCALPTF